MKQIFQTARIKLLTLIMAGAAGGGFAIAATAAGVGVNAGAQAGGVADAHMSASGSADSDAQWQSGATRGIDRAAERMSPQGAEMNQAGVANLGAAGAAAATGTRKR